MASQGLPLRMVRMATLLTGLLECLGFAGVLFGWASLVFVFKTEHYFKELCELHAGPTGNVTELDGKGVVTPQKSSLVGRGGKEPTSYLPCQPSCQPPPSFPSQPSCKGPLGWDGVGVPASEG